jgi:AraC family transcriptional regulator
MPDEALERDDLIAPSDWFKNIPFGAVAASDRLGWVGVEAARYRASPASEYNAPGVTHHWLLLLVRPPEEMQLRFDGVKRDVSPPAGSIMMVPAGTPSKWQWSGPRDTLTIFLEAGRIERVAAEAFELDAARLEIPSIGGLDLPELRAAMLAVDSEMTAGAAGSALAAECLANVLAVQLIRQATAPRATARQPDGPLPQQKLRAAVDYIHANLDANLTLEQIAGAAHLSAYHFSRQFKAATGMPPHQYVIARRVERAQRLMQHGDESSLAEIAIRAGFSDQSQFSNHFKRVAGVTPMQFRRSARTA